MSGVFKEGHARDAVRTMGQCSDHAMGDRGNRVDIKGTYRTSRRAHLLVVSGKYCYQIGPDSIDG